MTVCDNSMCSKTSVIVTLPAVFTAAVYPSSVTVNGERLSAGDYVVVESEVSGQLPYIARIEYLWETASGQRHFHASWFWYVSHGLLDRLHLNSCLIRYQIGEVCNIHSLIFCAVCYHQTYLDVDRFVLI